jgi:uncharacterized protein YdeI (YjbR/CyaY-like superfamily)
MCNTVDEYIESTESWQAELIRLRKVLRSTDLEETVKWGAPCYTWGVKNVVGLGAFKSYFGLWFFQGALLADKGKVLINAQEGKTRALRQWRFTSGKEIKARLIKAYVNEAIELQRQGAEIKPDRGRPVEIPPQLKRALAGNKKASHGFRALTPGKQREYADYISSAKREETRSKRLEKIIPMIAAGKGLHDRYRCASTSRPISR